MPIAARWIDVCDNGKMRNHKELTNHIQSRKVPKDLSNCTFTVCAQIVPPFIERGCKAGMEIILIRIIAHVLKFNLTTFCTTMPRGDVAEEDGSLSHLLLKLRKDECDFIMGSMYPDNDVHLSFKSSHSYFEDSYTWFVPMAPWRAPWKGLVVIFNWSTWLFLVLVLMLSSFAWTFLGRNSGELEKFKKFAMCILNSWSVMLGVSVNLQPIRNPLRILFMAVALYGLNITTVYTSKLIQVFTEPAHDAQIQTVGEIMDQRLPLGGREEYKDWFSSGTPEDEKISLLYNISDDFLPSGLNLKRVMAGHQAILMSRLFVKSKKYGHHVYSFKSNVFSNQLEIICEKGFPLLSDFNNVISLLKDSGVIEKIYSDALYEMDRKSHATAVDEADEVDIILTINHLQGAFAILGYGLLISMVCFGVEVGMTLDYAWGSKRVYLGRGYYLSVAFPKIQAKPNHKVKWRRRVFNWIPHQRTVGLQKKKVLK